MEKLYGRRRKCSRHTPCAVTDLTLICYSHGENGYGTRSVPATTGEKIKAASDGLALRQGQSIAANYLSIKTTERRTITSPVGFQLAYRPEWLREERV